MEWNVKEWNNLKDHYARVRKVASNSPVVWVGYHLDNHMLKFGDTMIKESDLKSYNFNYSYCIVAGKRYTVSMRNIATPEEFALIVLKKMAPEAMSVDDLPF